MTSGSVDWWRHAVTYQVYLRSFADGNGDGIGDLRGLHDRLGHLAALGVDAIWINPWYPSPLLDGGYDVSDHRDIDARYGTLADAEAMIGAAHDLGIRVICDLVPNHTSWEHPWFVEARNSPPGHASRARYHIVPGRGPNGDEPPNDWQAVFGGSAWERLPDGEWYLHIFDVSQPDLDWSHPEVRADFETTLRFWLDRGIDGFRIDVAHGCTKDPAYPDLDGRPGDVHLDLIVDHPYWDRDELHDLVRSWRRVVDEYADRMMVAEATVHARRLPLYLRPDEYHQSFNFDFLRTDWNAKAFESVIDDAVRAAAGVGATSTWVLSNHDQMRHATRYGLPAGIDLLRWPLLGPHDLLDPETGARRARAAALVVLSLPGGVYVYQGDELGLPEVWDLPVDVLDDPMWERSGRTIKGRDGCRVPIPWSSDGPSYGFGPAPGWLPQPASFGRLCVERQDGDPSSSLSLHRRAIAVRREVFGTDERITLVDRGAEVLAYERCGGSIICVTNMGSDPVDVPAGEVLVSSGPLVGGRLPVDTTVWVRVG
ncbi:MAG: glycoside hydrolase family 13 protein [Ilumatobacteraceae bacterium]